MTAAAVRFTLLKKVSYFLDFEALPFVKKDPMAYPGYAALQPILYQSWQMFLNDIMWSGKFSDLFTSQSIYTNQAMASAYGLASVSGAALQKITVTGDAYNAGLLTYPALLAASNTAAAGDDVIHRGLWIYYNLLGAPALPPPPSNALSVAMSIAGEPTRDQAAYPDGPLPAVRRSACALARHSRFHPLGLLTLTYDGIGRFRTADPGTIPPNGPVDDTSTVPSGIFTDQPNMEGKLKNAADLAKIPATSPPESHSA